jgi:multiple sugar transport system permease protein
VTVVANRPSPLSRAEVRRRPGRWRRTTSRGTWYVVVTMLALLFLSPLLTVLMGSFKTPGEAAHTPPSYVTTHVSFNNYRRLWVGDIGISQSIVNSATVAVATVVMTVIIALLAAYGFQRFPFRGSNALFLVMLASIMVPFQVLLTPLYVVLGHLHLTNSLVGLVVVISTFQLPFATFVIRTSFAAVPTELYEAASVDGAGMWATLRMMLPLLRPGIITAGLFAFFAAWNEFFAALILLSDQTKFTLPVILTTLVNGARGSIDWGLLQAGVVITILPCLVIFIALQRYYVRGLVAGSGK